MDEDIEAALMRAGAQINALQANERRLIDELAALRKDAERYRWLRDEDGAFDAFTAAYYNASGPADIDAAVDRAIATSGGAVGAA